MEMVTPPPTPSTQYGMGWYRTTELNRPFVWHGGGITGGEACNGLFLDDGVSISITMNTWPNQLPAFFGNAVIQAVCTASPSPC
jgi:hypothetical protein